MTEKRWVTGSQELCYSIGGQGVAVVMVHGFGEDRQVWNALLPQLETEFRLLLVDLPGSGCSSYNPGLETMSDFARLVLNLAKLEGMESFYLVGHSMGGYITLAFAEAFGELLRGFCLFHSSSYADSPAKVEARRKSIDFIRKHGSASFISQATPNLFSDEFRTEKPDRVDEMVERYTNFLPEALVQYYEAMINRPDRRNLLKSFTKPIAWIIGRHDSAIPVQDSLAQCYQPQVSHVLLLEHSGHMGMMEEPEKCIEFLKGFINDSEFANR